MTDLFGGKIMRSFRGLRGGVQIGNLALVAFCAAAFLPSFASALPAGYQRLEYIQATGQCRIKTGLTPVSSDKVEMTIQPTTVSGNQTLWCSRVSGTKSFTAFMITNTLRFDRNGTQKASSAIFSVGTNFAISANYATGVCTVRNLTTDAEVSVSAGTGDYTAATELCLFASHDSSIDAGLSNWASYRLFSFKLLTSGNALRLDLVPARRTADGALGLYDAQNDNFFVNIGSGAFVAGPLVCENTYTWNGGASGTLTDATKWTPAPQGTFSAADELIINEAAEITLNAAATVGKITLNATGATRFLAPGGATLTVGSIENTGTGTATFECNVQFIDTYNVVQNGAVKFPTGATATYPDNLLRTADSTVNTRTLDGNFTFTGSWSVNNVGDYPWIIPSGTVVHGQLLTGTQTGNHRILRIDEGGSAYFTTVTNGLNRGDLDIDGYLEVSGECIVQTAGSSADTLVHFGREGNIGTVKAWRIAKTGHSWTQSWIPNMIIGAGGMGSLMQDYSWRFYTDTTITASADFNFLGVYRSANTADWGIWILADKRLTINVPQGLTVTCGAGVNNSGSIRKIGEGTLVMTDTYNGQSGFKKVYSQGTIIDEGKVILAAAGQLGTGAVTIGENGTLEVASGVTLSNQTDGEGTLLLNNGATLAVAGGPWNVGAVEFTSNDASVAVTSSVGMTAPFTFLKGVDATDVPHFTFNGSNTLILVGDTLVLPGNTTTGAYVWNGASGDDWATPGSWLVDNAVPATAPASTDTIIFKSTTPITVGGTDTLTISNIVTLADALVTFSCPVAFTGTYLVENAAVAPLFAGGATATVPDASLTDMNVASHTLNGTITFTSDWTIPLQPTPFIVAAGSTLNGKVLAATTYDKAKPELRIDEGAVATFESVSVGGKLVFWLNGGNLVATGDITLGGDATERDFGYSAKPNIGTVEAHGIYKSVISVGKINSYVTNVVVGAGGFGMYCKDYTITLYKDLTLTAKDDLTIYEPQNLGTTAPKDTDWGLNLNGFTFTVNTASHTVTFDSWTGANAGKIVKVGAGEMIMQGRKKTHTGGTIAREGKMTVRLTDTQGNGPVTVESGATLANPVVVAGSSTLTLEAGAILKPEQNAYFDYTSGTVVLPAEGTVTVDMTEFTLVNGVANPLLGGVAAGDEAKFSALVPASVSGTFSVSGGFLYYTATAGGSAAADLYWHPTSDAIWSTSIAAWTNAAGEQVTFSPYANVTVADAATITLSENVDANDVTISADGNVALNGTGKIGGPGSLIKTGNGVFTFNAQGGIDAQPIVVSNGTFRLGDDLPTRALGVSADTSPIIIENGGTLDVNYTVSTSNYDSVRSSLTHDKLIKIAGDGVDGKGAIISTNKQCYIAFSDVELTDDATIGGTVRSDFRHSTAYGHVRGTTRNTLTGEGKRLTVKNTAKLVLVGTTINLGSILVTDNGVLEFENPAVANISDGIHLQNGTFSFYGGSGTANVVADSGDNYMKNNSGTATFSGTFTVMPGATLTHSAGSILYTTPSPSPLNISGGNAYLNGCVPANGFTVTGAKASETVRMRQSGTFTGANISCNSFGIADVSNSVVDVTFLDSTFDVKNLYLGWGSAWASGLLSIGAGTTVTAGNCYIGYDGTITNKAVRSVLSVDGGEVHLTGTDFAIGYNGPHSDFVLNSGTVTVDQAAIRVHANTAKLGGFNTSRFIQNGGTFNYGGTGFTSKWEDNTDGGAIVLKGGEFNATNNWSIPHFIPLYFKGGDADGWTLNQTDGKTITWNTALLGDGDVALNGGATLVGNKEVQGAVGGKWTVGDGFMAGLEGASSLLGGLDLGVGATASVNIATNRSAVFTAREFGHNPDITNGVNCVTNRFNRAIGGTTRGTITHDMTFFFTKYVAADRPFGDMNYSSTYAVGEFYVEEWAAGDWTFTGICDDWVYFWVDGEQIFAPAQGKQGTGTKNLTAGWHSFRHVIIDNAGSYGNAQTIGYKYGSMSSYENFSVKNLKMRPAADFGDPNNANTVRWSHYKQPTAVDWREGIFKQDDLPWDFCCITNNLQMLQWYGMNNPTFMNTNTVNRYDGWFLVTAENADKEWTFRTQYDDRCALWIDGIDSGLTGASGNTLTYKVTLARGWHRFEIRTYDNTGNAGPWNGSGNAVSYQVAGGSQTRFSEQTLALTVCPDGYVQGGVTLASNATLSNGATENAAVIYGDVTATGTGATMSGPFKFEGGKLAFQNVAANTRDLADVLAFTNPNANFLANVGEITVDFTDTPTRGKIAICPLGGMTQTAVEAKLSVTVNGDPFDKFRLQIENGTVYLSKGGSVLMIR